MKQNIVYCRRCIHLGRMDSITDYRIIKSAQHPSSAHYELPFQLSEQQQYASKAVVKTIKRAENLLLYAAVTGAGKTEMMFEGIQIARQKGHNVAILSSRVDVVIEISQRIKEVL
ncbi:DEAD/DEAH box helicase family protein [Staphylococcus saccharolyticus]|uniref:DEAD/DEAH box helicase family protein n=2 Tax=Staphylococcus saccharolyticus TaxID=33028 RepID=UPI00268B76EB